MGLESYRPEKAAAFKIAHSCSFLLVRTACRALTTLLLPSDALRLPFMRSEDTSLPIRDGFRMRHRFFASKVMAGLRLKNFTKNDFISDILSAPTAFRGNWKKTRLSKRYPEAPSGMAIQVIEIPSAVRSVGTQTHLIMTQRMQANPRRTPAYLSLHRRANKR